MKGTTVRTSKVERYRGKTLHRPTLVLNKNWQPVNVTPVKKALKAVFSDIAKIVDPEDYSLYSWEDWSELRPREGESCIQAVSLQIRIPEVICLLGYKDLPSAKVTFSRRNIFKRDRFTCQYCGIQPGGEQLTLDHVLPRSRGGISSWENCVLACVDCNRRKADKKPAEAHMRLKKEPHRPQWRPYYAAGMIRIESWEKFISNLYWETPLKP